MKQSDKLLSSFHSVTFILDHLVKLLRVLSIAVYFCFLINLLLLCILGIAADSLRGRCLRWESDDRFVHQLTMSLRINLRGSGPLWKRRSCLLVSEGLLLLHCILCARSISVNQSNVGTGVQHVIKNWQEASLVYCKYQTKGIGLMEKTIKTLNSCSVHVHKDSPMHNNEQAVSYLWLCYSVTFSNKSTFISACLNVSLLFIIYQWSLMCCERYGSRNIIAISEKYLPHRTCAEVN